MSTYGDMPHKTVERYVDEAMFPAVPLSEYGEEVRPSVTVITMTPDPLRVLASAASMYKGLPVLPEDISAEEAVAYLDAFRGGKIVAPLEWIQVALLIQGVSRDFTHQMVRQRTATFVQESMRFAVKDNAANEVPMPPSIAKLPDNSDIVQRWREHVISTGQFYNYLIQNDIPAEDARKALLIGTATRLHYRTDLRNLVNTAGMRLCSQAQAEWKQVWLEIVGAILNYGPDEERWQQREIVSLFKPVCYQTGKCEFNSPIDRWCVIRDRVNAHAERGEPPTVWLDISPHEPLHPASARRPR